MRNLVVKVPEPAWPEFKERVRACYQAPSRAIARELRDGMVADYERELPNAVACFQDDFEACIAHLRFPITHRRALRTTDEIDKNFLRGGAMLAWHGRPRGGERGGGCEPVGLPDQMTRPQVRRPCACWWLRRS
jgi:hypothetical protein